MKNPRQTILIIGVASLLYFTGCFSPVYDTARTTPGLTVGGGLAYHNINYTSGDIDWVVSGIRPDVCLSFAPVNWFSVVGHAGLLIGRDSLESKTYPFAGAGVKFSTPWEVVNLALRAELEFPSIGALTPMIGFSIPKRWEILTFGIKTSYCLIPSTIFINIHPLKGTHLFAGFALPGEGSTPEVCLGIGYTYTFDLSKKGEINEKDTLKVE